MAKMIHPLRRRDRTFVALLLLSLVLIGLLLDAERRAAKRADGASWRRIDLKALERRIDSGQLSDREALWFHPAAEVSQ